MKLPKFEHTSPSMRSAMVEPQLRSYAPQRKAMQKSTVLPNDVNAVLQMGLQRARMIGSTFEGVAKLAAHIHQTKVETESDLARTQYTRAMADFVAGVEFAPLSEEGRAEPRWMTGLDDYRNASEQIKDQIAERFITTEAGRRRFESSIMDYDQRNHEALRNIYRKRMISLARADAIQTVNDTMEPGVVTETLEKVVGAGLMDPVEAVKLEDQHLERIQYQTAVTSLDHLRSRMSGLSDDGFQEAIADRRRLVQEDLANVDPGKQRVLYGAIADMENDYYNRVKKERAVGLYGQMMELYASPETRFQFGQMLADPQVRTQLGEYYDDLVRLNVQQLERGRTDIDTSQRLEKVIVDYRAGMADDANLLYDAIREAADRGELSSADYRYFVSEVQAAREWRASEQRRENADNYKKAYRLLQSLYTAGYDGIHIFGEDGERQRKALTRAQVRLDRFVRENPNADPYQFAEQIIVESTPVPHLSVGFDGKPTDNPLDVDPVRTRQRFIEWEEQMKRRMEPDGTILYQGENISYMAELKRMHDELRDIEQMQSAWRESRRIE